MSLYVMINNFFFSYNTSIRVYRAQNVRNRIWPKRPTLHHPLAKMSEAKRFVAKTSYTLHCYSTRHFVTDELTLIKQFAKKESLNSSLITTMPLLQNNEIRNDDYDNDHN